MREIREFWKKAKREAVICCMSILALSLLCGAAPAYAAGKNTSAKKTQTTSQTTVQTTQATGKTGLTIRYIDVGQGDSALVVCDGEAMLVDGGESSQSSKIYTVLKNQNLTHLKYIVATHPHADHVGGLPGALTYADCDKVLSPVADSDNSSFTKLKKKCEQKNIPIEVPTEGAKYTLGGATLTILGPTDEIPDDPNNNSLFFRLDYGSTSFLFTGDAEQMEQQLLLHNEYDGLKADVIKMPHHGSSNGASEAFLKAVKPRFAVISCGAGNSYGHPHQETMSLLKAQNIAVHRTDLEGDILCTSDGTNITFTTQKTASSDLYAAGAQVSGTGSKNKSAGTAQSASQSTSQSAAASSEAAGQSAADQAAVQAAAQTAQAAQATQAAAAQTEQTAQTTQAAAAQPAAASNEQSIDYILNTNTKKFHYPNCSAVSKMKDSNKQAVNAVRSQLIAQGYSPCGICNP